MRIVASVNETRLEGGNRPLAKGRVPIRKPFLALVVAALVLTSSVAVYQQFLYAPLSAKTFGTVTLNGQEFYYLRIPAGVITWGMVVNFEGVSFHFLPSEWLEETNRTCTEVPYLNTRRTECTALTLRYAVVVEYATDPPHVEGLDTQWPFTVNDPHLSYGPGNFTSTLGLNSPWLTNFTTPQADIVMDTNYNVVIIYVRT